MNKGNLVLTATLETSIADYVHL